MCKRCKVQSDQDDFFTLDILTPSVIISKLLNPKGLPQDHLDSEEAKIPTRCALIRTAAQPMQAFSHRLCARNTCAYVLCIRMYVVKHVRM